MKNKITHITRNIKFKTNNKKRQTKVLDFLIDKFIKETNCKFVDFYLIGVNEVKLYGIKN